MFVKWLSVTMFLPIEKVFSSEGLIMKLCSHNGSFFMVGKRQTCMASGSVAKPENEGIYHDYWSKQTMCTALLPLIYARYCSWSGGLYLMNSLSLELWSFHRYHWIVDVQTRCVYHQVWLDHWVLKSPLDQWWLGYLVHDVEESHMARLQQVIWVLIQIVWGGSNRRAETF